MIWVWYGPHDRSNGSYSPPTSLVATKGRYIMQLHVPLRQHPPLVCFCTRTDRGCAREREPPHPSHPHRRKGQGNKPRPSSKHPQPFCSLGGKACAPPRAEITIVNETGLNFFIIFCSSVQFSSVQFSSVQCSSVQCSAVQFSSVQFSSVQHLERRVRGCQTHLKS